MSLVMVPACAKATEGAEPTQHRIKTKVAGSLARELVIHDTKIRALAAKGDREGARAAREAAVGRAQSMPLSRSQARLRDEWAKALGAPAP